MTARRAQQAAVATKCRQNESAGHPPAAPAPRQECRQSAPHVAAPAAAQAPTTLARHCQPPGQRPCALPTALHSLPVMRRGEGGLQYPQSARRLCGGYGPRCRGLHHPLRHRPLHASAGCAAGQEGTWWAAAGSSWAAVCSRKLAGHCPASQRHRRWRCRRRQHAAGGASHASHLPSACRTRAAATRASLTPSWATTRACWARRVSMMRRTERRAATVGLLLLFPAHVGDASGCATL